MPADTRLLRPRRLSAGIAVAGTPGAAHALARFAGGGLCPVNGEPEALAPLPLAALRVEASVLAAARRLGLETVGDLLPLPRGPLQRRFGKTLLARLDQALGRSGEPIEPVVPEEAPSALLRFAEPIATAEAIAEALRHLMAGLIETLRKAGLAARHLALLCDRVDGRVERIAIGTARATRDGAHLLRLLEMKIETIEPGFGLDQMRLVAGRVEPLAPEQLSGDRPEEDLAMLVDRLAGRLGPRRLYRATAVESDVPERSVARTGPLDVASPWPKWPRPVRLLSPPERVENVVALLPDLPPRRFTWRGRAYRVARADGPERIHGEWWKRAAKCGRGSRLFPGRGRRGRALPALPPRRRRRRPDGRPQLVSARGVRMSGEANCGHRELHELHLEILPGICRGGGTTPRVVEGFFQSRKNPSTMLCMVPLPAKSRGGF